MHTDSGMTGISLSGYMPYMTVASLEMSDEPVLNLLRNNIIIASRYVPAILSPYLGINLKQLLKKRVPFSKRDSFHTLHLFYQRDI